MVEICERIKNLVIVKHFIHISTIRSWPGAVSFLIDVLIGISLMNIVDGEHLYHLFWDTLYGLISYLDKLVTILTENPAGLKLNEPVNTALAGFFRYHIFLWHTFIEFVRVPILWNVLIYSLCLGFSTTCALLADAVTILSLHIKCFDVYASRFVQHYDSIRKSLYFSHYFGYGSH